MFHHRIFSVFLFFNLLPHGFTPSHEPLAVTKILKESGFSVFSSTERKILNHPLAHIASVRLMINALTAWWHRLIKRWTRSWQFYSFPEVHALHSTLIQLPCTVCFWPFIIWFGIAVWNAVCLQWSSQFSSFPCAFLTAEQCWTGILEEMEFTFFHLL